MDACGLVVEYNPFHYGHQYHLQEAKKQSNADCMIAVMSGNFLQRGEPAIIDKFHRSKVAINQGVDIVIELPFAYAVQNSDLFAKGAILTLGALGVSSICFGSEHGEMETFIDAYKIYTQETHLLNQLVKEKLVAGYSFPEANRIAYEAIGLAGEKIDLTQPNNILGFSYIKNIFRYYPQVIPFTTKRISNHYHDTEIQNQISSATSIRKQLLEKNQVSNDAIMALPDESQIQLDNYQKEAGLWHEWEKYFQLLQYRVLTMSTSELRSIHGMKEGIEYRLKQTAQQAVNFNSWMNLIKTKRYTWTRIQRLLVHVLANSKKNVVSSFLNSDQVPYIRLLGMSQRGQAYLSQFKKQLPIPIFSGLKKDSLLKLDEQASDTYYSIVPAINRQSLRQQEFKPPYIKK